MAKISTIIFDFGGIFLDLDYQKTFNAFSELLGIDVTRENAVDTIGSCVLDIEKGTISIEGFLWKIQKLKNGNLDPVDIIKAYNAMLLDIRPAIFPFLLEMKKKYRVILLSNTNAIHIRYVLQNILEKKHNVRDWDSYFHEVYYSHEMGMRKPDHDIYHEVINREGLLPEEVLFIDDTRENVTAAMECGWHAIEHDPSQKIEDKITEYIEACESI